MNNDELDYRDPNEVIRLMYRRGYGTSDIRHYLDLPLSQINEVLIASGLKKRQPEWATRSWKTEKTS